METEIAVEGLRPRVAEEPDAAHLRYRRTVQVLLATGLVGIQVGWLVALTVVAHWVAS